MKKWKRIKQKLAVSWQFSYNKRNFCYHNVMVDKGWLDMEDRGMNFIAGGRTRECLIYIPDNCQWKICRYIQIWFYSTSILRFLEKNDRFAILLSVVDVWKVKYQEFKEKIEMMSWFIIEVKRTTVREMKIFDPIIQVTLEKNLILIKKKSEMK
ncbi:MAG: hypothetical protein Ta2E_12340 [Mycoplasmoidaceae bacterium]|nr:MAG: hypothetical protein Ta2E_12340 [Mycoplasmoidaceae bacterium]